jgi:hypothetical protein
MARPEVAAGGDGLQISRLAANILNKPSRIADKGSPPALGLGVGLTAPRRKIYFVSKCHKGPRKAGTHITKHTRMTEQSGVMVIP